MQGGHNDGDTDKPKCSTSSARYESSFAVGASASSVDVAGLWQFYISSKYLLPPQRRLRSFLGVTLKGDLVPAHPPQVVFGGIVSTVLFSVCFLGVERFDGCEEAILGWLCMCSG